MAERLHRQAVLGRQCRVTRRVQVELLPDDLLQVAVQDFLEHVSVRNQTLTIAAQFFK